MTFRFDGGDFVLTEATTSDGPELCELFQNIHLKGSLELTQERDPDFFQLPRCHGGEYISVIGRDPDGRAIGCGTITIRDGWLNGVKIRTGYLCDLRVIPGFRGGFRLAQAYGEVLQHIEASIGAEVFTTVIFDSNRQAREALTRRSEKRKYQPLYRAMTPFRMTSIHFTWKCRPPLGAIRMATRDDEERLRCFLDQQSKKRILGEDFSGDLLAFRLKNWPGFAIEDFYLAEQNGQIVGCLAPWNTKSFKRTRVIGYHREMKLVKMGFNAMATLGRFPGLPTAGGLLDFSFLTHLEIVNDDPEILRDLLRAAYGDRRTTGELFMAAMIPRGSPFERAFSDFRTSHQNMTLYAVHSEQSKYTNDRFETVRPGFEMALS